MDAQVGKELASIPFDHDIWRVKYPSVVIARKTRGLLSRLKMTQVQFVRHYGSLRSDAAASVEKDAALRDFDNVVFSRFLSLATNAPNADAPKYVLQAELLLFACILSTTVEYLLDVAGVKSINPMSKSDYAKGFQGILQNAASDTRGALWGWGECLPCSFEDELFMQSHHAAIFSGETLAVPEETAKRIRDVFDKIGKASIEGFRTQSKQRTWFFKHLIFEEDLARIFTCSAEYSKVTAVARDRCLSHLAAILDDETFKAELWVIPGNRWPAIRSSRALQDIDALVVFDRHLAFWRSHSGVISYTDDAELVGTKREVLNRLAKTAVRYRGHDLLEAASTVLAGVSAAG